MSSSTKFPWAEQPAWQRAALTALTLPVAAPMLMLLSVLVLLMASVIVLAIPFAYVIAGVRGTAQA